MRKLHLITYGCQMNEYDSERVAGLLKHERYELTEVAEDADLILLNTCAIREKAEDKVLSRLGQLKHLKRTRPELMIGVMGCMAQLWKGRLQERAPHVDLVFGSAAVARVGELIDRARATGAPVLETGEAPLVKLTARPEQPGQLKAFVTVMEGCEKHCTFCVVPVTRGRERSHPSAAILAEVRELAAAGVREVTLLGQTVNAYGRDLTPATDLAALLEQVNEIDGIERIRFTTSNPYNLTSRLVRAIRGVPKVVEYLHLPLQSGSDRVLARVNRGYTAAVYLDLIEELVDALPDIALATGPLVGFPGETDEDFAQTIEMVERVAYDNVFAFRYSRRPGTPAATMPDQVSDEVKATRNTALLAVAERVGAERRHRLEGRMMPVLVDGASRKNPREATGRTRCNRVVNFDTRGRDLFGSVLPVRITQALPHSLRGEMLELSTPASRRDAIPASGVRLDEGGPSCGS